MNSKNICILIIMIIGFCTYGQETDLTLKGKVTFITSKNVYIKFENTTMINVGDTLNTKDNMPCLLVTNKSSSSVVSIKINQCVITKDMIVFYSYRIIKETVLEEETLIEDIGISFNDSIQAISKKKQNPFYSEDIRARLSASSYSTISEIRDDRHRFMTRFSLNANHINHSKISVETYFNYRYNINSGASSSLSNTDDLRIYNLAMMYDIDSTLSITAGRKINYKISSLGAIDGLQAEKFLGKNYIGAILGFRPDIFDYGFNPDLLQYGVFVGRLTNSENLSSQTTIGIAEQRNKGALDRRFTYLQHSSTINKKLNLFSTAELDIFNQVNDSIGNSIRLTNLYVSARYRFNRSINLMLSYDSRKRIIFYKTYETDIEELLDEDIARQGFRARLNIKPFKSVFTGLSYSKRFQNDSQNKSDNIYGYVSFSDLPIDGRVSLTYNMNSSNYLDSNIASLRYSRPFMDNRLNADFYYRFVNYKYTTNVPEFNQHYIGTYVSYYLDRSLTISLSGEYSTYNQEDNFRINTRIIKRFYRQRKK